MNDIRILHHFQEENKVYISAEKVSTILSKLGIAFSHDAVLRLLRKLSQDKLYVFIDTNLL